MKPNKHEIRKQAVGLAMIAFVCLTSNAATNYYVDGTRGDDAKYDGRAAEPTDTPSTKAAGYLVGPKQSLHAGSALVTGNYDCLYIAPGTYTLTNTVKNATLFASFIGNDPDSNPSNVVINGDGKYLGIEFSHQYMKLRNLTISNCYNAATTTGAGFYFHSGTCTISNCVFIANTNACAGGSGAGAYVGGWGDLVVQDCRFELNQASKAGGLHVQGMAAYIYNTTFERNEAVSNVGGAGYNSTTAKFYNCNFLENTAAQSEGGGWYGAIDYATNCLFRGCIAGGGGALGDYVSKTKEFIDCRFIDNAATVTYGGAIVAYKNGYSFMKCVFENNRSKTDGGGAIFLNADCGIGRLVDCTFRNNVTTEGQGGALYGFCAGMDGCLFEGNAAVDCGGAWALNPNLGTGGGGYSPDPFFYISNTVFRNNRLTGRAASNQSNSYGGAICLRMCAKTTHFAKCEFIGNVHTNIVGTPDGVNSVHLGGAVVALYTASFEDCLFESNRVLGAGGAYYGAATGGIRRCVFRGNVAAFEGSSTPEGPGNPNTFGQGGAIEFGAGSADLVPAGEENYWNVVEDSEFIGNEVKGCAGTAILLGGGGLKMSGCVFSNNVNSTQEHSYYQLCGGTLSVNYYRRRSSYSGSSDKLPIQLERCRFEDNTGAGSGGGLDIEAGNVGASSWVRNCLFRNNRSNKIGTTSIQPKETDGSGGGAYVAPDLPVSFENCTFVDNSSAYGGGIMCRSAVSGLTNCVFYGNADSEDASRNDLYLADATIAAYSFAPTTSPLLTEASYHNILSDANPFRSDKHCELAVKTGCGRNAGLTLDWMTASTKDLGLYGRINGTQPDFGCYECWPLFGIMILLK